MGVAETTNETTRATTPEVVRALVENHDRFLAFLQRRVDSRETAQELLQEAFVRGIDRGGSLRDGESAVAWFYRLLRNALVDHYRRQGAERRALEALGDEPAAGDDELLRVVCTCVATLIDTLKPTYAEALKQVELGGASLAGYAVAAGITPNNAAVRVHRAREALRAQLERSCGTCTTHGCLDCTCC